MLFVVMSIIPAAVLGIAAMWLFSNNLEANEIRSNQHTLEFLDYRLNQVISDIHKSVLLAAYDNNIRSYFQPKPGADADMLAAVGQMAKREIISLQLHEGADSVMLIGKDGSALVYSKANFARVLEVKQVDYNPLDSSRFRIHAAWAKPRLERGRHVVPYERVVLGTDGVSDVARLVVNYPETVFSGLFTRYERENQASFLMVDLEGTVMASTDESLVGLNAMDVLGVNIPALSGNDNSTYAEGYLYSYRINATNGYVLLEQVPLSVFSALFRPMMLLLLGISVVCIFVCLALGALLSHAMTKPLYQLIDRVSNDPTSAAHASTVRYSDEFAMLSDQYDVVIRRLESAIADYYEEQRKKKEAEVRALEFQINPHFLYNTLSTIIWLIDAGESDQAIEITKALSSFFRISISKGREFISLRDELCHVRLYVNIQKARYADLISVEYDVPDALLDCLTPKLILQPLVENAIQYGMRGNHGGCHVRIKCHKEADDIVLTVEDDGDRATEETIAEINTFLDYRNGVVAGKNYGIGISNVHDRIKMSFGEGYGLSFARVNGNTIVRIRIRAMNGDESSVPHIDS